MCETESFTQASSTPPNNFVLLIIAVFPWFHPNLLAVSKHNERNDAPRKKITMKAYISAHVSF
jgi:hypothetical protein